MEPEQPSANNPSEQLQPPGIPGQPPPAATPVYGQGGQTKTSGMAITSLVLGIVGVIPCFFFTLGLIPTVGLILGIVSLRAISKSLGQLRGRGMGIAGIVLSSIGLAMNVLWILSFVLTAGVGAFSFFLAIRTGVNEATHMGNMQQLCVAVVAYEADNGALPDPDNWKEQLEPYLPGPPDEAAKSPYDNVTGCGFAMNSLLIDTLEGQRVPLKTDTIAEPGKTVLFFESGSNSPPAGGRELLPDEPRGPQGYLIGFVDGHVENVEEDDLDDLHWAPEVIEDVHSD